MNMPYFAKNQTITNIKRKRLMNERSVKRGIGKQEC